jgi:MoaA/NifB/PqqE/SkfB family radical SAM enzyme
MDCAVISTYRCNAHCQMCNIWHNPSLKAEEFEPSILEKLPAGMARLNITGGEPSIREDLLNIVEILDKKTRRLEISTNGFFTDRLVEIAKRFPHLTIRVSVEGLPRRNDELRGTENGFDHALRTVLRLDELGVQDIGFAMVISDRNAPDLLDVYWLASRLGVEFSTSTLHNSFYFHKEDNTIGDLDLAVRETQKYVKALLRSRRSDLRLRVKDWFRAYLNLGLIQHMRGKQRPLPCRAGMDSFFVDPYGRILACNGSAEPWLMGDLKAQSFEEIWYGSQAEEARRRVTACTRNCWMMGTAVPALRRSLVPVTLWVLRNKVRVWLGQEPELKSQSGHHAPTQMGR